MLTSILSAICALSLGVSELSIQADTVNVYIIDGEKVENFDGSQLVGKTISSYRIGVSGDKGHGVLKIHTIQTGAQAANGRNITITGKNDKKETNVASSDKNIEIFIDGKRVSQEEMKKLTPKEIASVAVFTAGSKEAMELTSSKDKGAIVVELKK